MDAEFKAWIGQPVVLQVALGNVKVPCGETAERWQRYHTDAIGEGWDVDIYSHDPGCRSRLHGYASCVRISHETQEQVRNRRRARCSWVYRKWNEPHLERIGIRTQRSREGQEETYFTYEELRQICLLAVQQVH